MTVDSVWLEQYFEDIHLAVSVAEIPAQLRRITNLWSAAADAGNKIIFAGNGGSAAIASHCAVDLTKAAGIRAVNFNEADLITCFANDYGYSEWLGKAIEAYADPGDILTLISSSGQSQNIIRAAEVGTAMGLSVVTLSGFDADNPLRSMGEINLWVDSHSYNVVEMTHHIWLVAAIDLKIAEGAAGDIEAPS